MKPKECRERAKWLEETARALSVLKDRAAFLDEAKKLREKAAELDAKASQER